MCRNTQRAGTDAKTAANTSRKVKIRQRRSRRLNLPCRVEIETAEHPERWKHVSNKGNNGYAPRNVLIEDLGTQIQKFVFGQSLEVLGMDKNIEASVEGKRDGGKDEECDGDVDGTVSGGNNNPNRVAAARLAAQSQDMRNNATRQRNDLPVSPRRPANPQTPFHGLPRAHRQRPRITFEPRNISRTCKVKLTHLERANAVQSMWRPGNRIGWPSARARGSAKEELKTMDEEQRVDQQDQVTCAPRLLPNWAIMQKSQTFTSTSLKIGCIYSDKTQSFDSS